MHVWSTPTSSSSFDKSDQHQPWEIHPIPKHTTSKQHQNNINYPNHSITINNKQLTHFWRNTSVKVLYFNLQNVTNGINHFFYDWRMMASGWNPSVPSCSAISGAECSISVPASRQLWKDAISWLSKSFRWDLKPVCCLTAPKRRPETALLKILEMQDTLFSIYKYTSIVGWSRKQGNNKKPTNRQTNKQRSMHCACSHAVPGPTMLAPEVSKTTAARLPFVAFQTQANCTPRTWFTRKTTTSKHDKWQWRICVGIDSAVNSWLSFSDCSEPAWAIQISTRCDHRQRPQYPQIYSNGWIAASQNKMFWSLTQILERIA